MKLTELLYRRLEGIKSERARTSKGEPPSSFVPTRLASMDRWGGNKRKQITLYGMDTGGGKSLLKWHFAWAAATTGHTVTIVDLEDPGERGADRLFAHETGINSAQILAGDLSDKQVSQIAMACADMEEWADLVEYHEGARTGAEALEIFEEHPAELEMLDYLSALPHGKYGRERSISDFMWGWTRHCQDNDTAGVAFAQLKGEVSERGMRMYEMHKRRNPQAPPYIDGFRGWDAEDLAWCTDAGRNAKDVAYGFRPGRILKRLGVKAQDNVLELDYPKRNWGPEGRIRLGVDLKTARFFDLEKDKDA